MTCTFQQMFTSCCLQSPIAQHANPERGDNHSSTVTPSSTRTSQPAALSSRTETLETEKRMIAGPIDPRG